MILFKKQKLARIAQLEAEIKISKEAESFGQRMKPTGFEEFIEKVGELAKLKSLLGLEGEK